MKRSINQHDNKRSLLPIMSLFLRISREHIQYQQKLRIDHLKYTLFGLFIYLIILWYFHYDNNLYNALNGPFHFNSNQFIQHIQFHHKQPKFWQRIFFSFSKNYFQIELGENHIEKTVRHPYLQIITSPTITTSLHPNHLYVKPATEDERYYHVRLPFNFQLFSITTLKCIVRQLQISSNDYNTWFEKSIYTRVIEEYYHRNATIFNRDVLMKCGILIGFLYSPRGEYYLLEKYSSVYDFNLFDVAIDASDYYSLTFYILGCFPLIGLLIKIVVHLCLYIFYGIRPIRINIHSNIKTQFEILGINSVDSLTDLLYDSKLNSLSYHHHMFIVEDEYLIIFNVDFDEHNRRKLKSFYNESPFIVIPILFIKQIGDIHFLIEDGNDRKCIYFSSISDRINDITASQWLHDQLMYISPNYRHCYIETKIREKEKERYDRQFALLVAREDEIQRNKTANNVDRMMGIVKSASPRFIAQFCLQNHPTVHSHQVELLNSKCSICLSEFRLGKQYAQWPCPAQHYFHCDCMLDLLRESNKCPLCRHTVESIPSTFQHIFHRFFP